MFGFRKKPKIDRGEPIIVVSGLPRSGTSMTMRMIEQGGVSPVQDGQREADVDNPRGYYEDERVKDLANNLNKAWLKEARGKVIKIISFLLKDLPGSNHYKIVFMRRNLDEVLASQNKMLERRNEGNSASDEDMRDMYVKHLKQVEELVASRDFLEVLDVSYSDMVANPRDHAQRINQFLGGRLDVDRMVEVVDRQLYRNRAPAS